MMKQQTGKQSPQQLLTKLFVPFYHALFNNPINQTQSSLHKNRHIMINCQQQIGNFLENKYVKELDHKNSLQKYYQTKSVLIQVLIKTCQLFKLNTKFLCESNIIIKKRNSTKRLSQQAQTSISTQQSSIQSKQNSQKNLIGRQLQQIPFVIYLIKQIYSTFVNDKQNSQHHSSSIKYRENLTKLYYLIVNSNIIPVSHLQFITRFLCDRYYEQTLSKQLIQTSFRLIQSGLQDRNIYPYLYFIENSNLNAIKLLFNTPKWIFGKGMTVWTWFQAMSALSSGQKDKEDSTVLFMIKTDQGNNIKVKLHMNLDLEIVAYQGNKQLQSVKITPIQHKIKFNQITMMGIQLQVLQGGFLKSNGYSLNIRINGSFYKQSLISSQKMPKFSSNDMITDFILFDKFIGKVYSIIVSNKNELNLYQKMATSYSNYGICNENQVWSLIDSNLLKKQNIVGIFNAQRAFEGLLINYVGEINPACFSGFVSKQKYNKYDYQIVDVLMPYLYFLIIVEKTQKQVQNNREGFEQLFDLILKQIIKIVASQEKQQDFIPSQNILFILYFLELSNYSITQSTLNYLMNEIKNSKQTQNKYFQMIGQFLDIPLLFQKNLQFQNQGNDVEISNPVKKVQMLFLLQSKWEEKWKTDFQGFLSWWSPTFFNYQNDQEFNVNKFSYDQNRDDRVQWEVKNFITNDYCKSILIPVFKIPAYASINRYQKQYVGKQCMQQQFTMQIANLNKKNNKLIIKKYFNSTLDRMKKKLLGSKQKQVSSPQKVITVTKKASVKQQFFTQCLFVDLLSVIISTIKISKQGFITISSKHTSKQFDHMCVKAFQNQFLLYYNFHFKQISYIRKRRFNQSMNTLEIRLKSGKIYLLYFYMKNVDFFISILSEYVDIKKDPYSMYLDSKEPFKWIQKQMSNYEYIQWLNDVAGRNFLDIAQYPVLPWVFVADHKEQKREEKMFRNLMKNMGSHGPEERIKHFMEKYSSNNQQQLFNQYHFGTHYSSSAIIFNYLIRVRPFSIGAYTLQSGKFDCADRVFWSYVGSWLNATNSPTDLRELIPQIYTLPEMFLDINNYDFGLTQEKTRIDNVQLPKWSGGNPYKFISTIRKKLQSNYVSENINHWIDLIFGYKQRGQQAVTHMNIFFPLTYQDAINLDTVSDPQQKISFQTQIAHFGQNPSQIIGNNPHPIRMKTKSSWQDRLLSDAGQGILIQRCHLDKNKTIAKQQEKFLYKSIFQSKQAILSIKFLDDYHFIVIRKHQYFIFKILQKKSQFISKQHEISYELQSTQISINYKQLGQYVPTATVGSTITLVGGFFNGYVQMLFTQQPKCNQPIQFPGMNTITAIQYTSRFQYLYLADNQGYLKIYEVSFGNNSKYNTTNTKQLQFTQINLIKLHDSKINCLSLNQKANLAITCSNDGFIKLINLYSQQLIRIYRNPDFEFGKNNNAITFCQISTSPLYSVQFYSEKTKKIYSYSINGQYLASFTYNNLSGILQKQALSSPTKSESQASLSSIMKDFIYNLSVVPSSDTTQKLVLLTSYKDLFILQLPYLQQKRKIKFKNYEYKLSCFESCQNGRIGLTGSEDGSIQIIADPACY